MNKINKESREDGVEDGVKMINVVQLTLSSVTLSHSFPGNNPMMIKVLVTTLFPLCPHSVLTGVQPMSDWGATLEGAPSEGDSLLRESDS